MSESFDELIIYIKDNKDHLIEDFSANDIQLRDGMLIDDVTKLLKKAWDTGEPPGQFTVIDKHIVHKKELDSEYDLSTLVNKINDGNCILILGPYFTSLGIDNTEVIAHKLAKELYSELSEKRDIDLNNLHQVAQRYVFDNNNDVDALKVKAREFIQEHVKAYKEREESKIINEPKNKENNIYIQLTSLPFKLVISSCYDDLISWGFEQNGKVCSDKYHRFNDYNDKIKGDTAGTQKFPMIYCLYGSYQDENYKSLVLTEQERIDFLIGLQTVKNKLPDAITRELKDKRNILLFLGFDFNQWHLRYLLRLIEIEREGSRNLAFHSPIPNDVSTLVFYQKGLTLDFYDASTSKFIRELHSKYKELANDDLPVDAPKVFISYCREDKELADELNEDFKKQTIRGWVDRNDLPPGAGFNPVIEESISSKCDYFVSIRTIHYNPEEKERYAVKENSIARERWKREYEMSGKPFFFVINEGCEYKDPDINEIRYEDGPIANLIHEIKTDWRQRLIERQEISAERQEMSIERQKMSIERQRALIK